MKGRGKHFMKSSWANRNKIEYSNSMGEKLHSANKSNHYTPVNDCSRTNGEALFQLHRDSSRISVWCKSAPHSSHVFCNVHQFSSGQHRLTHITHQRHNIFIECFNMLLCSSFIYISPFPHVFVADLIDHLRAESIATTKYLLPKSKGHINDDEQKWYGCASRTRAWDLFTCWLSQWCDKVSVYLFIYKSTYIYTPGMYLVST